LLLGNGRQKAVSCFLCLKEKKLNSTVRTFPRTLDEAFPDGADYGCAIVHYRNPIDGIFRWSFGAALAAAVIALLIWEFK